MTTRRSSAALAAQFDDLPGCCTENASLEPYSDFKQQWGAADRVDSPKNFWRRRNNAARPSRQTQPNASTSRLYQNKSPHPTRGGDLKGSQGKAQPSPATVIQTPPVSREIPKYVQQCSRNGGRGWSVWLWKIATPDEKTRIAYTCGSWRCNGECQRASAARLYARLKEATDRYPAEEWVFLVLTLDRNGYYSGKPWKDAQDAYKALGTMTGNFLKRLRRLCKRRYWSNFGSKWAQVVECHKTGWPHVNVLVHSPELAAELRRDNDERRANGQSQRAAMLLKGDLLLHATDCGWGVQSSAEQVRSTGSMANYLVDIAKHGHEHAHELAKLTQLPLNAPRHFRRLRSGKGFLPPVRKNKDWTGALVRRYYDPVLGYTAEAIKGKNQPPAERLEQLRQCERIEEREFVSELAREAKTKLTIKQDKQRQPNHLPPVSNWTGFERREPINPPRDSAGKSSW